MIQISENAGRQIRKLLDKQGMADGGLRVGVKAGGCSGLSYVFAWETEAQPGRRAAGSGSWAGIFNTHFWVDPRTGITGALHTQCLPFVAPEVMRVYADVERAVYASSKTSSQASAK